MPANPTKNGDNANDSSIADRTMRLVLGRRLLWVAFWVGLAVHAVEAFWMVEGIKQMRDGSCTAALIGLWFGLPLVPADLLVFAIGAYLAKREDRRALYAGLIGTLLSVIAIPLWIVISLRLVDILNLG